MTNDLITEHLNEAAPECAKDVARQILGLHTLQARNNDSLDFQELHISAIERALIEAFQLGAATALAAADTVAEAISDDDSAGFLVTVSKNGKADWLTVAQTAAEAEDAARDWLVGQTDSETVAWVTKVEAFIHHPDA